MRREVLGDVRQLQGMLENHARAGLPAADLQVIRRDGIKALEYFSRHYGKVYVNEDRPISVKDALVGINQMIDEDANKMAEPPPVVAEPITRQFLRMAAEVSKARPSSRAIRCRSCCAARASRPTNSPTAAGRARRRRCCPCHLVDPLGKAFARDWQGRHRRRLTADLDQALVMMGACYDGTAASTPRTH